MYIYIHTHFMCINSPIKLITVSYTYTHLVYTDLAGILTCHILPGMMGKGNYLK